MRILGTMRKGGQSQWQLVARNGIDDFTRKGTSSLNPFSFVGSRIDTDNDIPSHRKKRRAHNIIWCPWKYYLISERGWNSKKVFQMMTEISLSCICSRSYMADPYSRMPPTTLLKILLLICCQSKGSLIYLKQGANSAFNATFSTLPLLASHLVWFS